MDNRGQRPVAPGDYTGRETARLAAHKQENDKHMANAITRINTNDGIRFVDLPGGGKWPIARELAEQFGLE